MNLVGAFVGIDAFDIHHVSHNRIRIGNADGAEHAPGHAGDLAGAIDVMPFVHADLNRRKLAGIFEPAVMEVHQLAVHNHRCHVCQLGLIKLELSDGLAKRDAVDAVV